MPRPLVSPVAPQSSHPGSSRHARATPRLPFVRLAIITSTALGLAAVPSITADAASTPQVIGFHGGGYDLAGAITVDEAANAYPADM